MRSLLNKAALLAAGELCCSCRAKESCLRKTSSKVCCLLGLWPCRTRPPPTHILIPVTWQLQTFLLLPHKQVLQQELLFLLLPLLQLSLLDDGSAGFSKRNKVVASSSSSSTSYKASIALLLSL